MTELSIDIETYSGADLKKVGVYKYCEDDAFKIQMLSYSIDGGPVETIDLEQGGTLPEWLVAALYDSSIKKKAWNAAFERVCLGHYLQGKPLAPRGWYCSAIRASTLGLPRSLGAAGEVLGLEGDKAKDRVGKSLITYFSKPCKPTKKNGGRTRNLPHHDIDKWELYLAYNKQDVVAEMEITKILDKYPKTTEFEQELYWLDQEINDRGVLIDMTLVNNIIEYSNTHQANLLATASELTGIDNAKSGKQSKEWLIEQGLEIDTLTKKDVTKLLEDCDDDNVTEFLKIKQQLGKTSVKKYEAMSRAVCRDNRVRGTLHFYGANRTGRWAGRIIQPQNMPRNDNKRLEFLRDAIKAKDWDTFEMIESNAMDVFSQLIRTALIPDKVFSIADYSAIEARVLAWLADERWVMEVFATHGKIYEATAAKMYKVPIDGVTKDMRQKGKTAILSCGYQGGPGALAAFGADKWMTPGEMSKLVADWRSANSRIVSFWYDTQQNAIDALKNPGVTYKGPRGLRFKKIADTLFIKLPSGRCLAYKSAKYDGKIKYKGTSQTTGVWCHIDTYGGKLVENITQAIARDVLAEALMRLKKHGIDVTFHVHDEIVVESDRLDEIKALMGIQPEWADGLITTAEAFMSDYYTKD